MTQSTPLPAVRRNATAAELVRAWAARAGRAVLEALMRAQQRRVLAELDDHLLRDIGLTREQVAAEFEKPLWRR